VPPESSYQVLVLHSLDLLVESFRTNRAIQYTEHHHLPSSCEKSKSQRSAESRGFSPGTPCFLPQGKLTGWVRHIGLRQIFNEVWTNSGCSSAICKLKVYLGLLLVSPVDLSNHNVKLLQFSVCCHGSSDKLSIYLSIYLSIIIIVYIIIVLLMIVSCHVFLGYN
jgi:hypothetical protein